MSKIFVFAGRYIHRTEFWVVSIKNSPSVEFQIMFKLLQTLGSLELVLFIFFVNFAEILINFANKYDEIANKSVFGFTLKDKRELRIFLT